MFNVWFNSTNGSIFGNFFFFYSTHESTQSVHTQLGNTSIILIQQNVLTEMALKKIKWLFTRKCKSELVFVKRFR